MGSFKVGGKRFGDIIIFGGKEPGGGNFMTRHR